VKRTPPALAHLPGALADLETRGLLRQRPTPKERGAISFCSNDYLGLADRSFVADAPVGAGASRLITGEHTEHRRLEGALCEWLGADAALTFTSGYAANVGLLSALAGPGDLIVSDALNHASIIDGSRLSRATVCVVPHLDLHAVEQALLARPSGQRAWVVTESYFSMDADGPDLGALRRTCDAYGAALIVDEAHALGVLGPEGRGLCAAAGIAPDVLVGTFGKAFGGGGAFVAGCASLVAWLWNRARSFVFSTGLSPWLAAGALDALAVSRRRPELRNAVIDATDRLRSGLAERGIEPAGFGHIVPWIVGASPRATAIAHELQRRGVVAAAIRPPSVPPGTARIRFTLTARHERTAIDAALDTIAEARRCALT
jgi:8-amino-7-oxononanoate synthase